MKLAVVTLLFSSFAASQQPATTSGPCSPIASHNSGAITINCPGISKEQGQKMIAILNRILANQLDASTVMEKLDEILAAKSGSIRNQTCVGSACAQGPNSSAVLNQYGAQAPAPHLTGISVTDVPPAGTDCGFELCQFPGKLITFSVDSKFTSAMFIVQSDKPCLITHATAAFPTQPVHWSIGDTIQYTVDNQPNLCMIGFENPQVIVPGMIVALTVHSPSGVVLNIVGASAYVEPVKQQ